MGKSRRRLQDLPYHIQEKIWIFVIDDWEPQVLFLEIDGLRNVPAKPFRDMASDTFRYLALEGRSGSKVPISDPEVMNSFLTRQMLSKSTWRVRFLGSLCANSRHTITKAFPHILGLRFMHPLNREKHGVRRKGALVNSHLRFNGDTDLCVVSAQWEKQTHYLGNQKSIRGAFKHIRNLGLDLGTLWNDRLLQTLDSSFRTDPSEVLRSDPRSIHRSHRPDPHISFPPWGYINAPHINSDSPLPPLPRRCEWRLSCGCWASNSQMNAPQPPRGCHGVCRIEPLPKFINALPKVRTLVLIDMNNPIGFPPRAVGAHRELFLSGLVGKNALIELGDGKYTISNAGIGREVVLPPGRSTLNYIRYWWRGNFPYPEFMREVNSIKFMRPIKNHTPPWKRDDWVRSSDIDIPYIYELEEEPTPTPNRKRSRESPSPDGSRKRRDVGHSPGFRGVSNGNGGRTRSRGRRRGRRRGRKRNSGC